MPWRRTGFKPNEDVSYIVERQYGGRTVKKTSYEYFKKKFGLHTIYNLF